MEGTCKGKRQPERREDRAMNGAALLIYSSACRYSWTD